jgi:hypothetical protein
MFILSTFYQRCGMMYMIFLEKRLQINTLIVRIKQHQFLSPVFSGLDHRQYAVQTTMCLVDSVFVSILTYFPIVINCYEAVVYPQL